MRRLVLPKSFSLSTQIIHPEAARTIPLAVRALVALALLAGGVLAVSTGAGEEARPLVVILDSGMDAGHVDFPPGTLVAFRDFLNGRDSAYDDHGHGTAVASRLAGRATGSYPGAAIAVGKVLDGNNTLPSISLLVEGLSWAVSTGAPVVSVSIGRTALVDLGAGDPTGVNAAIREARERGVLVVWSAGNVRIDPIPIGLYPSFATTFGASADSALVVGASGDAGGWSVYSRTFPEVVARGLGVQVALPGNATGTWSGSSFAAPFVAGAAARLFAASPGIGPDEVEDILLATATDRLDQPYAVEGYGNVDAASIARSLRVVAGADPMPQRPLDDAQHAVATLARTQWGSG